MVAVFTMLLPAPHGAFCATWKRRTVLIVCPGLYVWALQTTWFPCGKQPGVEPCVVKVRPVGMVSMTRMPEICTCPMFRTAIVYVTNPPGCTVCTSADL